MTVGELKKELEKYKDDEIVYHEYFDGSYQESFDEINYVNFVNRVVVNRLFNRKLKGVVLS